VEALLIPSIALYWKIFAMKQEDRPLFEPTIVAENCEYIGFQVLGFWSELAKLAHENGKHLLPLVPVASMLLALPAGESIDEFTLSSSGRTLTRVFVTPYLLCVTVERLTVNRMFIRSFG